MASTSLATVVVDLGATGPVRPSADDAAWPVIRTLLEDGVPRSLKDIAAATGLTETKVTTATKPLRDSGALVPEVDGKKVGYRLATAARVKVAGGETDFDVVPPAPAR